MRAIFSAAVSNPPCAAGTPRVPRILTLRPNGPIGLPHTLCPITIATTVAGLVVILGAFGAGSSFTQDGSNGASLGMALLAAVAMLCYAANLVILGKPGTSS